MQSRTANVFTLQKYEYLLPSLAMPGPLYYMYANITRCSTGMRRIQKGRIHVLHIHTLDFLSLVGKEIVVATVSYKYTPTKYQVCCGISYNKL